MTIYDTDQKDDPSGLADLELRRWHTPNPFPSWYEHRPVRVVVAKRAAPSSRPVELPGWVDAIVRRLATLMTLPAGWDGGGAPAVSESVAKRALIAIGRLMSEDSPVPTVVPTRVGGLQFEWHEVTFDLEIVVSPEGPIDAYLEDYPSHSEVDGPLSVLSSRVREVLTAGTAPT